ncbi:hypothetical protein [Nitrosococcus watsonii]|uniref:hypothetical protein n=1 Tax=Nitrosococcus watsonii TaxID=473531 RepID=UPI0002F987B8|nr:hypothetical protein [Nitrosococcus watsonii]
MKLGYSGFAFASKILEGLLLVTQRLLQSHAEHVISQGIPLRATTSHFSKVERDTETPYVDRY